MGLSGSFQRGVQPDLKIHSHSYNKSKASDGRFNFRAKMISKTIYDTGRNFKHYKLSRLYTLKSQQLAPLQYTHCSSSGGMTISGRRRERR